MYLDNNTNASKTHLKDHENKHLIPKNLLYRLSSHIVTTTTTTNYFVVFIYECLFFWGNILDIQQITYTITNQIN